MNELSLVLQPWLKEHGYRPAQGGAGRDYIELDDGEPSSGSRTTVGWIEETHVEVGTKLSRYATTLNTWYGHPFIVLQPASPDFFAELIKALKAAEEAGRVFEEEMSKI